ncbi:uncharacterized protein LOC108104381 [Drosophila eugracilis]|uniref:uncharacterized protein LOC108104381 n=1 Tax=Drosophila eugracilis TaxID=29029 RepID=UPI0007E61089|nr:uncharacterized protein LOC108104381 [Drosophila eugracilis]
MADQGKVLKANMQSGEHSQEAKSCPEKVFDGPQQMSSGRISTTKMPISAHVIKKRGGTESPDPLKPLKQPQSPSQLQSKPKPLQQPITNWRDRASLPATNSQPENWRLQCRKSN